MGNNSVTTEGDYTMSKLLPPPPLCPNCGDQMIRQFTGNDPAARVFYCQKCKKTMPRDGEAWHGRDILCGCYIDLKKIRTLMEKAIKTQLHDEQKISNSSCNDSIQSGHILHCKLHTHVFATLNFSQASDLINIEGQIASALKSLPISDADIEVQLYEFSSADEKSVASDDQESPSS